MTPDTPSSIPPQLAAITRTQRDELLRAFADHELFTRESLHIKDEIGSLVSMECRPSQAKLNRAIRKQEAAGKPVRIVVLKTRRSNFTAGVCAQLFHRTPFMAGRKALIIADKYNPAGAEALSYIQEFQNSYEPFVRHGLPVELPELRRDILPEPGQVKETIAGEFLAWENNSFVQILSAEGGEVGRGGGRHFLLGDEVAFWRNARQTLGGVLNMVPGLPGTMVILQSTANGIGGEFYDLCKKAQDPNNASGWQFLFFGWLEHPLYVKDLTEFEQHELARTLGKEDKYGGKEELTLHQMHGATLRQLAWRRMKIDTECLGYIDLFHQEYPTTPQEAFLTSGRPAIDHRALARMPVTEPIVGELQLVEDFPKNRIEFSQRDHGALSIFRRPKEGHRYAIGADPSKGIDVSGTKRGENPDYSVAFVGDVDTGEQVALLRARIRPGAFAEYLDVLCRWYNFAYLVPESNDTGFIDAILRTRYPEMFIYIMGREPGDKRPARPQDVGFYTDGVSRGWLVGAGEEAVRTGAVIIHSQVVIDECYTFEIGTSGKHEHRRGHHDDCVIAMSLFEIGRRHAPKRTGGYHGEERRPGVVRYGVAGRKKDEDDD